MKKEKLISSILREKKGEKTTSFIRKLQKKSKTTVYQMMNGCESPGARVRARARIQLEKLFPNSSKVKEEEEEEEEEEVNERRKQSLAEVSSSSPSSCVTEFEMAIQILREKLAIANKNLEERQRKCDELMQSNDDLRCMHKEVSKELTKLKRSLSFQGIGNSAGGEIYEEEEDDDGRSYLSSLLTEAKSEVLEKQLKIDSLRRKHLSMEKEITRLLDEQKITSKKEVQITQRFSSQLKHLRVATREKDEKLDELKMTVEALQEDKKSLEDQMSSMQREYDRREENTRIEMRDVKKSAFETSKKAYEYGRNFASLDYESAWNLRETEMKRKSTNDQHVFKAKLKSQRAFLLQTRKQLKIAKNNNNKLSRELAKTYIDTDKEKVRLEQTRIAELTKLKDCISERRRDVEIVQKEFNDLFSKKSRKVSARNGEDEELRRVQEELSHSKEAHLADVASLKAKLQKTENDSEIFEAKMAAHVVQESQRFVEKMNATALESERRTDEMLSLSDKIRSFIEEKKELPLSAKVVAKKPSVSKKLYRIFYDGNFSEAEEKENAHEIDFSWTPNATPNESNRKKPKSRVTQRSPLSLLR